MVVFFAFIGFHYSFFIVFASSVKTICICAYIIVRSNSDISWYKMWWDQRSLLYTLGAITSASGVELAKTPSNVSVGASSNRLSLHHDTGPSVAVMRRCMGPDLAPGSVASWILSLIREINKAPPPRALKTVLTLRVWTPASSPQSSWGLLP